MPGRVSSSRHEPAAGTSRLADIIAVIPSERGPTTITLLGFRVTVTVDLKLDLKFTRPGLASSSHEPSSLAYSSSCHGTVFQSKSVSLTHDSAVTRAAAAGVTYIRPGSVSAGGPGSRGVVQRR